MVVFVLTMVVFVLTMVEFLLTMVVFVLTMVEFLLTMVVFVLTMVVSCPHTTHIAWCIWWGVGYIHSLKGYHKKLKIFDMWGQRRGEGGGSSGVCQNIN
jgi:hypothetical protein